MSPKQTILLAAAVLIICGSLSAVSAMPMAPLSINNGDTHQARVVCDQFGRCFRTGPRYRSYGYRYGYRAAPNCYWNGCCPQGMTIQGGVCRPYRGP